MVETTYDEQFFVEDNIYMLYFTEINKNIESNDSKDKRYENSVYETRDTYALKFKIYKVVLEKTNGNLKDVSFNNNLKKLLFKNICEDYKQHNYKLYEEYNIDKNTNKFKIYFEYKNRVYNIYFKR